MAKITPEEVFTPRAAVVNEDMYVARPELEAALRNALSRKMHIIIHGESGTGKSWLYKKMFAELGVETLSANLANASRLGSIAAELQNLTDREEQARKTSYAESKKAEANVVFASGELNHEAHFEIGKKEPFEACLASLRKAAGKKQACLVLDNLEMVFSNETIMKELADMIVLLDDARYSSYDVSLVIVGVPDDVRRYFSKIGNLSTVANRLTEIPEVARLTPDQAKDLIQRGLVQELKYTITEEDLEKVITHVIWVTDRIPQQVHEYCLELANIAERKNRVISSTDLATADRAWSNSSLYSNYVAVEALMNSRETTVGRRNQTIYAIGIHEGEDFRYSDIEEIVRAQFPTSTNGVELNIVAMLAELSRSDNPIIKRTPREDAYRFVSPKYRMAIRSMLRKTGAETIEKVDIRSLV